MHGARTTVYAARRRTQTSLMVEGIFRSATADSEAVLRAETQQPKLVLSIGED